MTSTWIATALEDKDKTACSHKIAVKPHYLSTHSLDQYTYRLRVSASAPTSYYLGAQLQVPLPLGLYWLKSVHIRLSKEYVSDSEVLGSFL